MRRGEFQIRPLAFASGEERYLQCPENLSPETFYERQWALALIGSVFDLMRAEQETEGKARVFDRLKGFLTSDADYRQAAASGCEKARCR